MEDLLADRQILACNIIFSEYGLPRKIMSDASGIFIPGQFLKFCKVLNIECAASSLYHHKGNGQVEACVKLVKCTVKKCCDTISDIHLALLQVRMMPLRPGLSSPATHLYFIAPHQV